MVTLVLLLVSLQAAQAQGMSAHPLRQECVAGCIACVCPAADVGELCHLACWFLRLINYRPANQVQISGLITSIESWCKGDWLARAC